MVERSYLTYVCCAFGKMTKLCATLCLYLSAITNFKSLRFYFQETFFFVVRFAWLISFALSLIDCFSLPCILGSPDETDDQPSLYLFIENTYIKQHTLSAFFFFLNLCTNKMLKKPEILCSNFIYYSLLNFIAYE